MVDFCLSNGPMLSSSSDTELSSNSKQAFALTPCLTPILDKERVRGKHSTRKSKVFLSCVSCRTSKAKCAEFRPCTRCQRSGNSSSCTSLIMVRTLCHCRLSISTTCHQFTSTCLFIPMNRGCQSNHRQTAVSFLIMKIILHC